MRRRRRRRRRMPDRRRGRRRDGCRGAPPCSVADSPADETIIAPPLRGVRHAASRPSSTRSVRARRCFGVPACLLVVCEGTSTGTPRSCATGDLTRHPAPSPRKVFVAGNSRAGLLARGSSFPVPSHPPGLRAVAVTGSSPLTAAGQRGLCTLFPRPSVSGAGLVRRAGPCQGWHRRRRRRIPTTRSRTPRGRAARHPRRGGTSRRRPGRPPRGPALKTACGPCAGRRLLLLERVHDGRRAERLPGVQVLGVQPPRPAASRVRS